jgi:ABC-type transport system involved in cytochrome c biogenesis permease subunit
MSGNKPDELRERSDRLSRAVAVYVRAKETSPRDLREAKLVETIDRIAAYAEATQVTLVPPATGTGWVSFWRSQEDDPAAQSVEMILLGYAVARFSKDPVRQRQGVQAFNSELEKYQAGVLAQRVPASKAGLEVFFNHFAPFYQCAGIYVLVLLLACLSWMVYPVPLLRTAFWLAVIAFVVHTGALVIRMFVMDRPMVFVTNLYSSAVFIGWVAIMLALAVELIFRNGFGLATGAVIGIGTTIIAHFLALGNDTLAVLQAVLDTNFWLATHVTSVTIGYSATFFAGVLGCAYIFATLSGRRSREQLKPLYQMIYGIVCFAMLFSFVGTVLGGIWADQSWGRFWGWDSKENGAVMIVIWNALVLHARWGGMARDLGVACLAVVGNIITAWSWFGTNMLGVGLHTYGFMDAAFAVLVGWAAINAAIAGVGLLWWLFKPQTPKAVAAA